jgi:hypothetical protein
MIRANLASTVAVIAEAYVRNALRIAVHFINTCILQPKDDRIGEVCLARVNRFGR